MVIVAQKNHHTKFFQQGSPDNVPPGEAYSLFDACHLVPLLWLSKLIIFFYYAGTVIDNKICHPKNNDFYLCAHAGMIVSISRFLFQLSNDFYLYAHA